MNRLIYKEMISRLALKIGIKFKILIDLKMLSLLGYNMILLIDTVLIIRIAFLNE